MTGNGRAQGSLLFVIPPGGGGIVFSDYIQTITGGVYTGFRSIIVAKFNFQSHFFFLFDVHVTEVSKERGSEGTLTESSHEEIVRDVGLAIRWQVWCGLGLFPH